MDDSGRNGLCSPSDIDECVLAEEDIVDVIELEPKESEDVTNEMEMLDVSEKDCEEDAAFKMQPSRDDAKLVFANHKGSVFCVALDTENDDLAITGGEDDMAFVWKVATGEVILECTGHKDSVTCGCFSPGSKYVATGDLSGLVQVWDIKQLKLVWSFEVSDLEWLSWHQTVPVLLAGTKDGDMWMWKLPQGMTKTFQSFGHSCNVGQIMPDGKRCVAGYDDGSVRVWDLKDVMPVHTFSGHTGHQSSVTSISCHSDNNIVLTGSTDCTAVLYSTTTGKMLTRLQCRIQTDEDSMDSDDDSVETVGLSNILPYAATGTLSGHLMVWDVPTQLCRHQCRYESGIVKLIWHDSRPLIYSCCLDGTVHLWDARTGNEERCWYGHEASILDMQINKGGDTIVTTSDDKTARIFVL